MKTESIQLAKIRTDGGTQPRAAINPEVVADYRERAENGEVPPPIKLVYDGSDYWLVDGFHRVESYKQAQFLAIDAEVLQGDLAFAQAESLKSNKEHDKSGLRRTNADKERAVERAFSLPFFNGKSDRFIAEWVGVGNNMVSRYRASSCANSTPGEKRTGRDGKSYPATQPTRKPQPERVTESEKVIVNTQTGEVIEEAEVVTTTTTREAVAGKERMEDGRRGRGVELAHEAINILKRIPVTDPLREEGLNTVARWIRDNK